MFYKKEISVPKKEAEYINGLFEKEPASEEECFGEDETITYGAEFEDGRQMDVKVCGVQYEEGGNNTPYTEAVLFDKNGHELCCTDCGEDLFGSWRIEYGENVYFVNIKEEIPDKTKFENECYEAYRLDWMIAHGHSLTDYLNNLPIEYFFEGTICENSDDPEELFEELNTSFEEEIGFNGSLWVCKDEFLGAEFQDVSYMEGLLGRMDNGEKMLEFYKDNYSFGVAA